MKPFKHLLPLLTLGLIIVNLTTFMLYVSDDVNRWMRFGNMILFFLLFITPYYYNKKGLIVLILFLICDGLLIYYESAFVNALIFITRSVSYLLLAVMVVQRVRKLKTNLLQKLIFTFAVALNIFLLYSLIEMVPSSKYYTFIDFLFYIYGISVIVCVIIAVSYSNRYADKTSLFFLGAVLSLAFSDLTYFISVYLKFSDFYLAVIVFNILGIALVLQFLLVDKTKREVSNPELME